MQGCSAQTISLQGAGQSCTTQLAVDKHKGLRDAPLFHNLLEGLSLVVLGHIEKQLCDGGCGLIGSGHLDGDRVLQIARGQSLDLWRKSGREQERGALLGQVAQDALQVGQEANVEHAVSFVEHHIFHLVQHRGLGFDVVQQTAWCGHQHFNTAFELCGLRFHVHAAKHHGRAKLGVLGVHLHLLGHLVGQLTGGQQDQGAHGVTGWGSGAVFVLDHALQKRQRESSGFAGAGLCGTHDILTRQDHWNGLRLNRCHGFVTHFSDGFRQIGV